MPNNELTRGPGAVEPHVEYLNPGDGDGGLPRKVTWGELIAGISALYACSITAFNAGYFGGVTGHFSELFTLTDLVGLNLRMVEFFFFVMFLYSMTTVLMASMFPGLRAKLMQLTEKATLIQHDNPHLYWMSFFALLGTFWIAQSLLVPKTSSFFLMMLPMIIFFGFVLNYKWVGYKYGRMSARPLVIELLVCLLVFSLNAGSYWIASEVRTRAGTQAIYVQDGSCIERKILRTTSTGLLLYSFELKQFEFRHRDFVRTIYDRPGCTQ